MIWAVADTWLIDATVTVRMIINYLATKNPVDHDSLSVHDCTSSLKIHYISDQDYPFISCEKSLNFGIFGQLMLRFSSLFLWLPVPLKKDAHKEMVYYKCSGFSVILQMKIIWLEQILLSLIVLCQNLID